MVGIQQAYDNMVATVDMAEGDLTSCVRLVVHVTDMHHYRSTCYGGGKAVEQRTATPTTNNW
jgi:hypothetical protein